MSRICKPTILIDGIEYISPEGLNEEAPLELLIQSVIKDPELFSKIKQALLSPIKNVANISSFSEVSHVIPSNADFLQVNDFMQTTGRVYQPVVNSIQAAIQIILGFGKPKLLWIDGDIQINGASVPSILLGGLQEDLIILKSHKLEDINNTLQEYIFKVILDNNGSQILETILQRFPIKEKYSKRDRSAIVKDLTSYNIFDKLLYDEDFNKFIDEPKSSSDKKRTMREEINEIINDMLRVKNESTPLYFSLNKVISGGLTGVDMIGVEVARELNYATGGTMPVNFLQEKHFITVNGKSEVRFSLDELLAQLYGFTEVNPLLLALFNNNYVARTEENAKNSDGTLYFPNIEYLEGRKISAGLIATRKGAEKYRKPFKEIDWRNHDDAVKAVREFIKNNKIRVLNIAGSRGSNLTVDQETQIRKVLEDALKQELPWIQTMSKETSVLYDILKEGTKTFPGMSITEELKQSANKMEMSFDYRGKSHAGIVSKSTFEAIIRGERTSTTRYGENLAQKDELNHLLEGSIIAFYQTREDMNSSDKLNVIYVRVTGKLIITPEMAQDIKDGKITPELQLFIDLWVSREGWSEEYLRDTVVDKIILYAKEGKSPNAVLILYEPILAEIVKPVSSKKSTYTTEFALKIPEGTVLPNGVSPLVFFDGTIDGLVNSLLDAKGIKSLSRQERMDLKRQVNIVLQRFPNLKKVVGLNVDDYIDYLLEKFPNSVEKAIYWHGTDADFSQGFKSANPEDSKGSGSPVINTGKGNIYFNKLAWTSLLYISGVNRTAKPDKDGFAHWNKLYWELKEIMSNGRRNSNDWRDMVIGDNPNIREEIPNKGSWNEEQNQWNEGTYEKGEHGKTLTLRKADYGYENKTNEEFFTEVFGIRWGQDTFNTWIQRNARIFLNLEKKTNEELIPGKKGGLYPAIINISNPLIEEGLDTYYEHRGTLDNLDTGTHDAVLSRRTDNEFGSDVAIVKARPENIYFLGTEQDILAFKAWKESRKDKQSPQQKARVLATNILTSTDSNGVALNEQKAEELINNLIQTFFECS